MLLGRRTLFGAALLPFLPRGAAAQAPPARLAAGAVAVALRPDGPPVPLWSYGDGFPGPELRLRQGERLQAVMRNALPVPTAVHWRGVRLANGAGEAVVQPGTETTIDFAPPDAGTFLYHPMGDDLPVLERGLAGVLVVEEREPPRADRDVVVVFREFLLAPNGRLAADLPGPDAAVAAGNVGSLMTVNGRADTFRLATRPHERLRLRLVNASVARILACRVDGPSQLMAIDGMPTEGLAPAGGRVVLPPGGRADLVVDAPAAGARILAARLGGRDVPLVELAVPADAEPARPEPLPPTPVLPPWTVPTRLDLARALRVPLAIRADLQANDGRFGVPGGRPLFQARRNATVVLQLANEGPAPVVLHPHGHSLRLLDGLDDGWKPWLVDSLLLAPGERVQAAFVADNPGRWALDLRVAALPSRARTLPFAVF